MLGIGIYFNIAWMQAVAGAYLAFLWVPFTVEKIVTTIIAIFLLKLFFPKDEYTLGILMDLLEKVKGKLSKKLIRKEKSMQNEKIELTRAEIDALDKHSKKVRSETVREIFSAVEELIEMNKQLEHSRGEISQSFVGEQMHSYAERLCVTLLVDLQRIREKYDEQR